MPLSGAVLSTDQTTKFASLSFVNVGSVAAPVWELQSNVIPRTGTLATLQAVTSGSGELASASDVEAIVQLRGTSGSGTATVYSPMAPGVWTVTATTANFQASNYDDSGGSHTFTLAGSTNSLGTGGAMILAGGSPPTGTNASGGGVSIQGGSGNGTGFSGGSVTIRPGRPFTGATAGAVRINSAVNTTTVQCGPTASTLGFFAATPVTKPAVTGSTVMNPALTSLLAALASLGLITNSTTA